MGAVDDVYTYLIAQSIVDGGTGWEAVRRRGSDDASDQMVVISEDGGPEPEIKETVGIGDSALNDIGVLILVRGAAWDSDATLTKALEIFTALHGKRAITLDTKEYLRIRARTAEPVFLGFDDLGRPRHTIGFLLLGDA